MNVQIAWEGEGLRFDSVRGRPVTIDCARIYSGRSTMPVTGRSRLGVWHAAGMLSGSGAAARPDDALLVGKDRDLYAVAQVQLGEDAGDVALYGCLAEVELRCDLGIRQALGYQPHDLELPLAEAPGCAGAWRGPAAEVLDQAPGDGGSEQRLASRHRPHGAGQLLTAGVLEQEAARAGLHRAVNVLIEVEGGQHQDPRPAAAPDEQRGCLDPVQLGHADVHQDYVGIQPSCLRQRLAAVPGLAGDAEVRLGLQQHPQALADEDLIIDDQDADHGGPSPIGSRARTAKPPPGCGPASSSPPNIATRSRMPASPCPPACGPAAESPEPSSLTSIVTAPATQPMPTSACAGPACFKTLVSASCTMR